MWWAAAFLPVPAWWRGTAWRVHRHDHRSSAAATAPIRTGAGTDRAGPKPSGGDLPPPTRRGRGVVPLPFRPRGGAGPCPRPGGCGAPRPGHGVPSRVPAPQRRGGGAGGKRPRPRGPGGLPRRLLPTQRAPQGRAGNGLCGPGRARGSRPVVGHRRRRVEHGMELRCGVRAALLPELRHRARSRPHRASTVSSGSCVARNRPSWRARANTASNMGSVSTPVKVFCWLGWYEHRSVRPSGSGVLGQVAELRARPQARRPGHALAGELAQHHDHPHVVEERQLPGQDRGRRRPAPLGSGLLAGRGAVHGGRDVGVAETRPSSRAVLVGWEA